MNSVTGGMIDRTIKHLLKEKLNDDQIARSLMEPVQNLAERMVYPASFFIGSPLGIKDMKADIVSMQTGEEVTTQLVTIDFHPETGGRDSSPVSQEISPFDDSKMVLPGLNEVSLWMPIDFIESVAGALGRQGVFTHAGEKFKIKYKIIPGADITVMSIGTNNEIQWNVPVEINLDAAVISRKLTGVVLLKMRTRIVENEGIYLDLVESQLAELDTSRFPLGAKFLRDSVTKTLREHLAATFPKAPLIKTNIPVLPGIDFRMTALETKADGIHAFGNLEPMSCELVINVAL